MEVTPHLIHQEKTFHPRMRQRNYGLGEKAKKDRAFQPCRQHCNACDTGSCDMQSCDTGSCDTGSRPVTELAGSARVLWQSYFSLE